MYINIYNAYICIYVFVHIYTYVSYILYYINIYQLLLKLPKNIFLENCKCKST